MTGDIVEFIRERLAEDERKAKAARTDACGEWPDGAVSVSLDDDADVDGIFETHAVSEHVTCHDPDRVLRGVKSRRRMLDLAVTVLESGYTNSADAKMVARDTLGNLAAEYSTHPGYRQDWAL